MQVCILTKMSDYELNNSHVDGEPVRSTGFQKNKEKRTQLVLRWWEYRGFLQLCAFGTQTEKMKCAEYIWIEVVKEMGPHELFELWFDDG